MNDLTLSLLFWQNELLIVLLHLFFYFWCGVNVCVWCATVFILLLLSIVCNFVNLNNLIRISISFAPLFFQPNSNTENNDIKNMQVPVIFMFILCVDKDTIQCVNVFYTIRFSLQCCNHFEFHLMLFYGILFLFSFCIVYVCARACVRFWRHLKSNEFFVASRHFHLNYFHFHWIYIQNHI